MKILLIIWLLLQVPLGVIVGKCLKGREHDKEIPINRPESMEAGDVTGDEFEILMRGWVTWK